MIKLSEREERIMDLVLDSYRPEEISQLLGIRKRTVKQCFTRMYKRLGIVDGIKIVKLAVMVYRDRKMKELSYEVPAKPRSFNSPIGSVGIGSMSQGRSHSASAGSS